MAACSSFQWRPPNFGPGTNSSLGRKSHFASVWRRQLSRVLDCWSWAVGQYGSVVSSEMIMKFNVVGGLWGGGDVGVVGGGVEVVGVGSRLLSGLSVQVLIRRPRVQFQSVSNSFFLRSILTAKALGSVVLFLVNRWVFYEQMLKQSFDCQKVWHIKISLSTRMQNVPYRVGSANFSQRRIGHAHDNSADPENSAGAPQPNVHAHFIFHFENGPGNESFFSIHNQDTAETSQPQGQPTDDWRAMDRACPRGLQRPLENLIQHGLVEKKKNRQTSWIEDRKLLLKGYKFKEGKYDRFGKRPAATALRRSTNDRRRRT